MNDYRKLGESEAQCNTLRDEVKQLKAEIEQLKVGGKSGSKIIIELHYFRIVILNFYFNF